MRPFYYDYYTIKDSFQRDVYIELGRIIPVDWKRHIVYSDNLEQYFNEILEKYNVIQNAMNSIIPQYFHKYPASKFPTEESKKDFKEIEKEIRTRLRSEFEGNITMYKLTLISKEQERLVEEQKQKEWESKSWVEKTAINLGAGKTAPTLKEGWVIYIVLLFVGIIFVNPICWMLGITFIFILWRKNEIDKYN